jgi:hypothetical protein
MEYLWSLSRTVAMRHRCPHHWKKKGKVGEMLTLGRGIVLVSEDFPNTERKRVGLCGTVPRYPKVSEIRAW